MFPFLLHPVPVVEFRCGDVALRLSVAAEEEDAGRAPVDWAGPVGEEEEETDGEDVVARDTVVRV